MDRYPIGQNGNPASGEAWTPKTFVTGVRLTPPDAAKSRAVFSYRQERIFVLKPSDPYILSSPVCMLTQVIKVNLLCSWIQ